MLKRLGLAVLLCLLILLLPGTALAQTSITVTAPTSGQVWSAGTTQTIAWTYTGFVLSSSSLSIQLYKGGVLTSTLASANIVGSGGSGSFNWAIPITQAGAADYSIKVVSNSNAAVFGTSPNFTIVGPSISVTAPAGGEVWQPGTTHTLSWTYTGSPGSAVSITLLQGGVASSTITSSTSIGASGSGSFSWTIPANQASAANYQVKVASTTNPGINSTSNNFSVQSVSISMTSPNGGESWTAGSTQNITWSYVGNPGSTVSITLLKGGVVNSTITASTPVGASGTGSFSWAIPGTQAGGSDYAVQVASTSTPSISGTSAAPFTIVPSSITVTAPNGGEVWPLGSAQNITWSYVGNPGANVEVDLLKGGVLNTVLSASTPIGAAGSGSFPFTVPNNQTQGQDYTVRVTSTSTSSFADTSNAPFTIGTFFNLGVTLAGTGTGTVTSSPAGINCGSTCSASFASGSTVNLTATATGGGTFAGWSGGGCSGTTNPCAVTMSSAQSVTASFTAPPASISITAPNGGEVWTAGTTQNITWTYSGSPGANVSLTLLKGGVVNSTISASAPIGASGSGSFAWAIPAGQTLGSDYKVQVTSTTNGSATSTSAANFTITGPSITVTSPAGGVSWGAGTTQTISWNYSGNVGSTVSIQLLNNGSLVSTINASASVGSGGSGSFSWAIPTTQAGGNNYTITVTSTSNTAVVGTSAVFTILGPSITVTSPNGGEVWAPGSTHTITWTYAGSIGSSVTIQLYKTGALNTTIASGVSIGSNGNGSFSWTIAAGQTQGSDYQIKLTSSGGNGGAAGGGGTAATDFSDGNFSIATTPSISGFSPGSGGWGTPVTISGGNFSTTPANNTVTFNGTAAVVSTSTATSISTSVPQNATTGLISVTTPGGSTSSASAFTVANPVPSVSSVSPPSVTVGSGSTLITVNGSNFIPGSVVNLDGSGVSTTYISSTQLSTTVPAGSLTTPHIFTVTVFNPAPAGGTSATSASFSVVNPTPTVSSVNPSVVNVGSPDTPITVTGTGYVASSVINLNGSPLTTAFNSATSLGATVPAASMTSGAALPVTVVTPGPGGGTSNSVNFIVSPVSASTSTVSANPTTGVIADGSTTSTITVTVKDAGGNPSANQTVTLSATGSGNTITQPASVTNASGVATGTIASTKAETKTITATVTVNPGGFQVVLNQKPTVAFVGNPATISAGNSTASANPASNVVANGVATSTITVTVLDANSNPVSGQAVQLAASGSNNTLVQPGLTNASGVTTGTIASTKAETKTITVTVNPGASQVVLTQQPTVGFIGNAATISAANSTASANPTSGVAANGSATSTITVTVVDANNNPVPGQTVQLAASGSGNILTQPAATNAAGTTTGTLASTAAGTKTVTVTVNPGASQVVLTQQPTVSFIIPPTPRFAFVANQGDNTVSVYIVDATSGLLRALNYVLVGSSPAAVATDAAGKFLYVANSGSNNISAFTIGSNGTLAQVAGSPFAAGTTPVAVLVDPSGQFLYAANKGSNNVSVYTLNASTGALTAGTAVPAGTAPVALAADVTGTYLYAVNNGSGNVSGYTIGGGGALTSLGAPFAAGTNPVSIVTDATGGFAWVANAGSGNISMYSASAGVLTGLGTVSVTSPSDITLDPSGTHAYVSTSSGVSAYSISGGTLTLLGSLGAGTTPSSVTVDPSGSFAYVTNSGSNDVSRYSISGGALTAAGSVRVRVSPAAIAVARGFTAVSYTSKFAYAADNGSGDVSMYTASSTTGALGFLGSIAPGLLSTRGVAVHPSGRFVYTASKDSNTVSIYSVNPTTGVLSGAGSVGTVSPFGVAVEPSGRFLYVSNSPNSAATISMFVINQSTGALGSLGSVSTVGSPRRLTVDPTGRFLLVAGNSGQVETYSINPVTGGLTAASVVGPGGAVFDVSVDPTGRFAYASNQNTNVINMYFISPTTGALGSLGQAGTGSGPRALAVTPAGTFAYSSNFFNNNLTLFSVNTSSGALAGIGTVTTSSTCNPIYGTVDPTGKFLYIVCSGSNSITGYSIGANGSLTQVSSTATDSNPHMMAILPQVQ